MKKPAFWTPEIIAACTSIASLGGLVVILLFADGQPIYSIYRIPLNTVVSIFATISKIGAVYVLCAAISQAKWILFAHGPRSLLDFTRVDNASRGGAFACANMLIRTPGVATVGAIAILLAVAFEPFLQQLVRYEQEVVYSNDTTTTLPIARRYSAGTWTQVSGISISSLDQAGSSASYASADLGMQSAVLYGLTKSLFNATQQLSLHCVSGNCTWPTVESLAVCSACNDVSNRVDTSRELFGANNGTSPTWVYLSEEQGPSVSGNLTRYTLPNDLWIDNLEGIDPVLLMTSFGTPDPNSTVTFTEVDTLIFSMTMLKIPEGSSQWPPEDPIEATECALYYCVREYHTTVSNSTVLEVSHELAGATRNKESWQPEDMAQVYSGNLTAAQLESISSSSRASFIQRTDLMLGENFNLSQSAVDGISAYFQSTFMDWNVTKSNTMLNGSGVGSMNGFYLQLDGDPQYEPSAIQPLKASPDLNGTFATVAISMSNAMRADSDGQTTQEGKNGALTTKFRIEWPWFALPAVVILASIVQLIMIMHASQDDETPVWKSSTLATLSRGRFVAELLGDSSTVEEMEQAVGKQRVDLFDHTMVGTKAERFERGEVKGLLSRAEEVTHNPAAVHCASGSSR